jgi:2'-5' RNA ligase
MPRVRVGVALLLPEPVASEVNGLRRALGDSSLGRVAPHVTLVAPVNVRDADAAVDVLRHAASPIGPLQLHLGPPATFLPDSAVVYLRVSGELEQLDTLRRGLLRPPLDRPPAWPFVPHVTLLDEARPARVPGMLEALAGYEVEVRLDTVHLLREGSDGVWHPLAGARLGGRGVVGTGGLPLETHVGDHPDPQAAAWASLEWERHDRELYGPEWRPDDPFAVVAQREGRTVGLAEGRLRGSRCELSRLIVGAAERDRGVGTRLVACVESIAREAGCESLRLRAAAGSRAETFFLHRGFMKEAHLPGWRGGRDFSVLARKL